MSPAGLSLSKLRQKLTYTEQLEARRNLEIAVSFRNVVRATPLSPESVAHLPHVDAPLRPEGARKGGLAMTALEKPVRRVTRGALSKAYGRDSGLRLVAVLEVGDLLSLRPLGTRRPESVSLFDVYRFTLTRRVNCEQLEKAREKKKQLAITREDRRLRRPLRA